MESGYYPPGAEHDPNAPYNQSDPGEVEVEICVSQSLSKNGITCYTTDYTPGTEQVDYDADYDEDGNKTSVPEYYRDVDDFNDTDWNRVAEENNIKTPLEIINEFKDLLDSLEGSDWNNIEYIEYWRDQCKGWIEDDLTICQE